MIERELGITKARETLGDVVEQVQLQGDTYVISRYGKPVAAIVPIEVYENWKRQRGKLFDTIGRIRSRNEEVDPDQVMQDVLQAQQAIRSSR
jgi:prevent-host-death family protein